MGEEAGRKSTGLIRDYGWNTWNFREMLSFSHLENGREKLAVRVSFLDDLERRRLTEFRWRDLVKVGPHATDGSYSLMEMHAGFEAQFTIEAASRGRTLFLVIDPTRTSGKRPVVEIVTPGTACARRQGDHLAGDTWQARAQGAMERDRVYVAADHPYFVGGRGARLVVACSLDSAPSVEVESASEVIADARRSYEARCLTGEGGLAGAPEAMMRAIAWNTIHDASGRGIETLISRNWSMDWNTAVLFGWDTFFVAMMAALEDPELAYRNVEAVLQGMTPGGFVPNWRFSNDAATLDRSHPPVGGLALARIAATSPDRERLRTLLPGMLKWHTWWNRARDRRGEGLLSWGSSPEPVFEFPEMRQVLRNEAICAAYESGLDNSPTFDGVPFDTRAGMLMAADVGLNALHAADAEALALLARSVGENEKAAGLEEELAGRRDRIRKHLWDDTGKTFANRYWSGAFSCRIAPTSFYPLLCGAATQMQASALIHSQLRDPAGFQGEWMLPSIRRDDPAFLDQDYWRGRIWPPMNFLTATGLRRAGFHEEASALAFKGLRMFMRAWREESHVYENYSAITGAGGDVPNADPFYVWGGLLAYTAIQEIFDIESDGSLAFGSRDDIELGLRNIRIRGDSWHVQSGRDGVQVLRGTDPVIESTTPCRIAGYTPEGIVEPLRIQGGSSVRIHGLRPDQEVKVDRAGEKRTATANSLGILEVTYGARTKSAE